MKKSTMGPALATRPLQQALTYAVTRSRLRHQALYVRLADSSGADGEALYYVSSLHRMPQQIVAVFDRGMRLDPITGFAIDAVEP